MPHPPQKKAFPKNIFPISQHSRPSHNSPSFPFPRAKSRYLVINHDTSGFSRISGISDTSGILKKFPKIEKKFPSPKIFFQILPIYSDGGV